MNERQPIAVDPATRANMLARLLGEGGAMPAAPQRMGPQMTQGDPNAAPYFPPPQELMAGLQAMPPEQRRALLTMLMQRFGQ